MQQGIDIIDVERFKDYDRERLEKMFTARELAYADSKNNPETLAGLFCAKEAFFKALGTGLQISKLHEVEITHTSNGVPQYKLSPDLIDKNGLSTAKITLSISHTQSVAVAVCIIFKLDSIINDKNMIR